MRPVELDRDRWARVSALLDELQEVPAAERRNRLDEAGCDEATKAEVQALLDQGSSSSGFLTTGAAERFHELLSGDGPANPVSSGDTPGTHVGPWKILREVGRGGMGAVYLAERADRAFEQRVALKVIKRGMDSDQVLARFLAERQILARLDHPNIARILDGGMTGDGRPYFAMEYVDGERLTEHCDRQRLSTEQRLRLFLIIAAGVHHAHQNLVVHRDLKPANILVNREGTAKLLDFGIAKALDPDDEASPGVTRTGMRPMTPEYASPEQLAGEAVTTATDTYSLGVILYELLCGARPQRTSNATPERPSARITAAAHVVSERRRATPDRLRRELAGDLDNIVLMAMRGEPARRYVSVAQLAEDVQRHLDRRPVLARQDTLGYRVATFVRRNWLAVLAAALATTALVATMVFALLESDRARRERLRADRRTDEARAFALSLVNDLEADADHGLTAFTQLSARRTLDYLDTLSDEVRGHRALAGELARAYVVLGSRQAYPAGPNSGDPAAALDSFRKAIQLLEARMQEQPTDDEIRHSLIVTYSLASLVLLPTNVTESLTLRLKARDFLARATAVHAPQSNESSLAASHRLLGEVYGHPYYSNLGDTARALTELRTAARSIDLLCRGSVDPADADCAFGLPTTHGSLAGVLWASGDIDHAIKLQGAANEQFERWWRAHTGSRLARNELALQRIRLANFLAEKGERQEALEHVRTAASSLERMLEGDPNDAALNRDLVRAYNLLGSLLLARRPSEALSVYRKAIDLGAAFSGHPEARERLADSHQGAANALAALGQKDDALTNSGKAIEIGEALVKLDPKNAHYALSLAVNYSHSGRVAEKAGDRAAARELYGKALAILEPMTAADPINVLKQRARTDAERRMRALERAAGD